MDSDLFNHLQKLSLDEKLTTAELQKYTYQLLRGLEAIHRAGVLHRDLVRVVFIVCVYVRLQVLCS